MSHYSAHYELYCEAQQMLNVYEDRQENLNITCASMPLLLDILEELGDNEEVTEKLTFLQMFTMACYHVGCDHYGGRDASRHMRVLHKAFSGSYPVNTTGNSQNYQQDVYDSSYLLFLTSYLRSI